MGASYDLNELCDRLTAAGYARCEQVEGPGQFAVRGGILDFYSPAAEQPVRAEFWGDELDSMGVFDPATQRRVENIDRSEILPAAETLPRLAPGGLLGLAGDIDHRREQVAAANRRRKLEHFAALTQTLENDARAISELGSFTAADRYLDLIYPDFACAADYLPPDAILLFCDSPRVSERRKELPLASGRGHHRPAGGRSALGGDGAVLRRLRGAVPAPQPGVPHCLSGQLSGGAVPRAAPGDAELPLQAAALLRHQSGGRGQRPDPLPEQRPCRHRALLHPGAGQAAGGYAPGAPAWCPRWILT